MRRGSSVPSWLLLVLMTIALGVATWSVARDKIVDLLTSL